MKHILTSILLEAIDLDSYDKYVTNKKQGHGLDIVKDMSPYKRFSLENPDLVHRYWAYYANLYDKVLHPIKSMEELERVKKFVPQQLPSDEYRDAFKVFVMYKEAVLSGTLKEGFMRP